MYGDYEQVSELAAKPTALIYLARRGGRNYVLKVFRSLTPAEEERTEQAESAVPGPSLENKFLDGVKVQKKAAEHSRRHFAPVYDAGITEEGAWYATDYYARGSLRRWIGQAMDAATLRRLVWVILEGLLEMRRITGRSHGNLKPANILIGGASGTALGRTPIFLMDPLPGGEAEAKLFELADLRALGELILQLVTGHQVSGPEEYSYPIEASEAWNKLGEQRDFWLDTVNRLLHPRLTLQEVTLERLVEEIRPADALASWGGPAKKARELLQKFKALPPVPGWVWKTGAAVAGVVLLFCYLRFMEAGMLPGNWVVRFAAGLGNPAARKAVDGWNEGRRDPEFYAALVAGTNAWTNAVWFLNQGNYTKAREWYDSALSNCTFAGSVRGVSAVARLSNELVSGRAQAEEMMKTAPPAITVQPVGAEVVEGTEARLGVAVTGSGPLNYQWRKDGDARVGATNGDLVLTKAQTNDAGRYTVRVSNRKGAVTSEVAMVTVRVRLVPPAITVQPVGAEVVEGTEARLSVTATGSGPLNYQWRKDGDARVGATNGDLVLTKAQTNDAGRYSVRVSNRAGAVTSEVAVVTVRERLVPPGITVQPVGAEVVEGTEARLSVMATGSGPLNYQWRKDGDARVGATNGDLVLTNAQTNDAGRYTVRVNNRAGAVTSEVAVVTVRERPAPLAITVQPVGAEVVEGTEARLRVVATGSGPLNYQWRKDGDARVGATNGDLVLTNAQTNDAGRYTVRVSNRAGAVTSEVAVVAVTAPPSITQQPRSQMVAARARLTLQVTAAGSPPLSYQWRKDGKDRAGATNAELVLKWALLGDTGRYTVQVTNRAGAVTSEVAVVTVRASVAPEIIVRPALGQ
jgi:hypothetical protein